MDCPQCGGTLIMYALSGQEASVCEDCGYVGISAEHRGESRRIESWNDALRRFYRAHGTDEDPNVELQPPLSRPSDGTTESWDDALRRFRERRTNGGEDESTAAADGSKRTETDTEADRTEPNAKAETDTDESVSGSKPGSQSQSSADDS